MVKIEKKHCQVVGEAMYGERAVDHEVLDSIEVLSQRLSDLTKVNPAFENIGFSPYVQEMAKNRKAVALC
jgi:hypothetical protein